MHCEWSRWMTWRFNSIMRWHRGSLWVKGHLVTTVKQKRQVKTDKDGELKAIRWFFCSPTQSLSTQSSCCPYNPAITGPDFLPWLLLPHYFLFFFAEGLSRISKSSFLSICLFTTTSVLSLSQNLSLAGFFSTEEILVLIILSPLCFPILPPSQVCPSTISLWPTPPLLGVYWVKAILSSFLLNSGFSPLQPFITLNICVWVCARAFVCMCVKTVKQISQVKIFSGYNELPAEFFHFSSTHTFNSAFKKTRAHRWRLRNTLRWVMCQKQENSQENTKEISSGTE